jgi:hypothetical protein
MKTFYFYILMKINKKDPLVYIDEGSTDYKNCASLDRKIQKIKGINYFVPALTVQPRNSDPAPPIVSIQWLIV